MGNLIGSYLLGISKLTESNKKRVVLYIYAVSSAAFPEVQYSENIRPLAF